MACPPVRDFSELIVLLSGGQTWYNYFIPHTSVQTLHVTRAKAGKGGILSEGPV